MPNHSSDDRPGTRSFLRTGAEPPHDADANGMTSTAGQPETKPIFPPPDPQPEIIDTIALWNGFSAWALHIDPPGNGNENGALLETLEGCLAQVAHACNALWFRWDTDLYGCVMPAMDAAAALTLARRLQEDLATQRVETMSIGISQFPCIDYSRPDTLRNACKALDHAAFFGPGSVVVFDAVSLNISGDHCYQAGRLDEAIAEYHAALKLDPSNVNVHNSLGGCLAQKEDWPAARAIFENAHHLDPVDAMVVYNLGIIDLLDGQQESALEKLQRAHAMDPNTFEIPFQIGKLLTERKDYAGARRFLENALARRSDYATAHTLLGQCLTALGHTQQAIMACKKAVKLNPNDAAALSDLGTLYAAKGENPDICITFCRQSVALCPDNGLYRMRLAALYHKQEQLDLALAEYRAAATLGCDAESQIAAVQAQLASSPETTQRYA